MNSTFYAVVIDWVGDEGTSTGGTVKIFNNAEAAQKFYDDSVVNDKVYSELTCGSIIEETDNSYLSYEDGNYTGNHCSIRIETIEGNFKDGLEVKL